MKYILVLLLLFIARYNPIQASGIGLGIMNALLQAEAIAEVEILDFKDSSEIETFPNGNTIAQRVIKIATCRIVQSTCDSINDTVRCTFVLNNHNLYDSLGNEEAHLIDFFYLSGEETSLKKEVRYILILRKGYVSSLDREEWIIIRSEQLAYKKVLLQYQISIYISQYIRKNYLKENKQNNILYSEVKIYDIQTRFGRLESVLYYNPLVSKFVILKKNKYIESKPINFSNQDSVISKHRFYYIKNSKTEIKLNKKTLQ